MKTRQYRLYLSFFAFIVLPLNISHALELNIPLIKQEKNNWCWAACCQMTLKYYAINKTQTQCAEWVWAIVFDKPLPLYSSTPGDKEAVNKVLEYFGSSQIGKTYYTYGTLSKKDIFTEINKHSPIIILGQVTFTPPEKYHDMMIRGYYDNHPTNPDIVCIDPDKDYGIIQSVKLAYLQKVSGVWEWQETLRLQKKGLGGTGIFDGVAIAPADFTYTQPAVARVYTGDFIRAEGSYAYATQWKWELVFSHDSGEYLVGSYNDPNGPSLSTTWSAPSFTLPNSYRWTYTNDGEILGYIRLSCLDTDGFFHDDTKEILYLPPDPLPMSVVYANTRISGFVPDVKAHQTIILRNCQINSGANVTFKAGEEIILKDNVNAIAGCTAQFIIDPSIR